MAKKPPKTTTCKITRSEGKYLSPETITRAGKSVAVTVSSNSVVAECDTEQTAIELAARLRRFFYSHGVEATCQAAAKAVKTCAALKII